MQCMIENRGLFMENNIKEESRLKFGFVGLMIIEYMFDMAVV